MSESYTCSVILFTNLTKSIKYVLKYIINLRVAIFIRCEIELYSVNKCFMGIDRFCFYGGTRCRLSTCCCNSFTAATNTKSFHLTFQCSGIFMHGWITNRDACGGRLQIIEPGFDGVKNPQAWHPFASQGRHAHPRITNLRRIAHIHPTAAAAE